MWGLPDSFIVGTTKRVLNAGKKSRRSENSLTESKEIVLAQSWECFNQDSRSLEQLLAEARQHRSKNKKV